MPGNSEIKKLLTDAIMNLVEEGVTEQSALRDVLTDLRHLSDERELGFHAAVDGSYEVYLEERDKQIEMGV